MKRIIRLVMFDERESHFLAAVLAGALLLLASAGLAGLAVRLFEVAAGW